MVTLTKFAKKDIEDFSYYLQVGTEIQINWTFSDDTQIGKIKQIKKCLPCDRDCDLGKQCSEINIQMDNGDWWCLYQDDILSIQVLSNGTQINKITEIE